MEMSQPLYTMHETRKKKQVNASLDIHQLVYSERMLALPQLSRSHRGKGNEETRIATNRRLYLAGGGGQIQMTFTVDV